MASQVNGQDKLSIIAAGIVLVALLVWGGYALFGKSSGDESRNVADQTSKEPSNGVDASKAIALSSGDLRLDGPQFVEKYAGKYISFDGISVFGSTESEGHDGLITKLLLDDSTYGTRTLRSGVTFVIPANNETFSEDLKAFASEHNPEQSQKMKVTAKVKEFTSGGYNWIVLEPRSNKDGATPSITKR